MSSDVVNDVVQQINCDGRNNNEEELSFMERSLERNQDAIILNGMDH